MKSLLEPHEVLILSYGLGLYRLSSLDDLNPESKCLEGLGISEVLRTSDTTYVAISGVGKLPSHMELAIHQTPEFKSDEQFVILHGSKAMKDRFFKLHELTTI